MREFTVYRLAESYEYSSMNYNLFRDRIIVAVFDATLPDRLQAKADLARTGSTNESLV